MATINEIKQQAAAVKNATQVGENTADRVGGALAGLADIAEQQDTELGKKFDKESIVQESGDSEDKVMSQKAVSDKLSDLDCDISNLAANINSNITIKSGKGNLTPLGSFKSGDTIYLKVLSFSSQENRYVSILATNDWQVNLDPSILLTYVNDSINYTFEKDYEQVYLGCFEGTAEVICKTKYSVDKKIDDVNKRISLNFNVQAEKIGNTDLLNTQEKTSCVASINEVLKDVETLTLPTVIQASKDFYIDSTNKKAITNFVDGVALTINNNLIPDEAFKGLLKTATFEYTNRIKAIVHVNLTLSNIDASNFCNLVVYNKESGLHFPYNLVGEYYVILPSNKWAIRICTLNTDSAYYCLTNAISYTNNGVSNNTELNSIVTELFIANHKNVELYSKKNVVSFNLFKAYKLNDTQFVTGINIKANDRNSDTYKLFNVEDFVSASDAIEAAKAYTPNILDVNGLKAVINWDNIEDGIIKSFNNTILNDRITLHLSKNLIINEYEQSKNFPLGKLYGKTINFLGDSITRYGYYINTLENKYNIIANRYGLVNSCIANGTSSSVQSFLERYSTMTDNCDAIIVFGGINDFTHNIALGSFEKYNSDGSLDNTFYGALHTLCRGLRNKYIEKPIIFLTPLHENYNDGNYDLREFKLEEDIITFQKYGSGDILKKYVDAIKEVCQFYAIPVIDTNGISGICPIIENNSSNYTLDGLHPNQKGGDRIADALASFISDFIY